MSFRRDSYSIVRLNTLLSGSIKVDRSSLLYLDQNNPVKFIKTYGTIVDKALDDGDPNSNGNNYLIKIDDGTGSVWIKANSIHAAELKKWDFVRVIGYILLDTSNGKDYDLSIFAEAIKKVENKNWELVHILEAQQTKGRQKTKNSSKKTNGQESNQEGEVKPNEVAEVSNMLEEPEEPEEESLTSKIEKILRENDSGNGVEFSVILKLAGTVEESEVDDILFELAYEGKVYQPRPDFYKIME